MDAILEAITRGWANFLARPGGPLNLRFIAQPAIGVFFAIRAGLKDARQSRPPYLWTALTNRHERWGLLHGGWKQMRTPFLTSVMFDSVYQLIVHRGIYILELVFTATLLTLVPYAIVRGPVSRVARRFVRQDAGRRNQSSAARVEP